MKLSKSDAVKAALAKLGTGVTAAAVQEAVKCEHKLDVSKTYVYHFLGGSKKKTKAKGPSLNGKHQAEAVTVSKGIALADIERVRELTSRLGAENFHALVALFAN